MTGRPSIYSDEIADAICERLADGQSLRSICLDENMPGQTTVFRWLGDEREEFDAFRKQYARARELQADAIFDEILDIADDSSNDWMDRRTEAGEIERVVDHENLQRSRLRVDARKWMAGKLRPKVYGEKHLIGSDPDNPLPNSMTVELVKTGG